jgi:integrase
MQALELFLSSIRSPHTKKAYDGYFKKYQEFVGVNEDIFCGNNPRLIEHKIIDFITDMKARGKGYSAIHNYAAAVSAFYKINDVVLNVSKINKFIPLQSRVRKDRAYIHEEISKILEFADERMRVVILLMVSAGIRRGALPYLRLRDLDDNNRKLTVYENEKEEYFSFITPECKKAVDSYLDMRGRYGEKLDKNSYLIREHFNKRDQFRARSPKQMTLGMLKWTIVQIIKRSGVRTGEVKESHGFRKFFTTQLINLKINPEIREMLLGHKIGLASCYYRPTEEEMYQEYEKAIDNLTIDPANRLQRKVEVLTLEKSKVDLALMQIEEMKKRIGLD